MTAMLKNNRWKNLKTCLEMSLGIIQHHAKFQTNISQTVLEIRIF